MSDPYNIHPTWGVPKEDVSCPGCGHVYGHHRTTVCSECEECSSCCQCEAPNHIPAKVAIENFLTHA